MCQRLYIATAAKLPTARRTKSAPYLEVAEEACRGHSTVALYLCWVHEEPESPATRRTVTLG
jgi:hypothetical protein